MDNKKNLIIILVSALLIVLLIGGTFLYNNLSDTFKKDNLVVEDEKGDIKDDSSEETTEVQAAPDITIYDYDGKAVQLSDFKGKAVILNFWASWCGPCKSEMPDFETMYKKYGNDIHFLMVNLTDGVQETEKSAKEFIKKDGYTFPTYYDLDSDAAYTYSVYSIPTTYFIDADGNFVAQGSGALDMETLQKGIDLIYEK